MICLFVDVPCAAAYCRRVSHSVCKSKPIRCAAGPAIRPRQKMWALRELWCLRSLR